MDDIDFQNMPEKMTQDQVKFLFMAKTVKDLQRNYRDDISDIKSQNKLILSQTSEAITSSSKNHESLEDLKDSINQKDDNYKEMIIKMDRRLQLVEKDIEYNKNKRAEQEIINNTKKNIVAPWITFIWNAFQSLSNFILIGLMTYVLKRLNP